MNNKRLGCGNLHVKMDTYAELDVCKKKQKTEKIPGQRHNSRKKEKKRGQPDKGSEAEEEGGQIGVRQSLESDRGRRESTLWRSRFGFSQNKIWLLPRNTLCLLLLVLIQV